MSGYRGPLPPRPTTPAPDLRERRAWTADALDSLGEARGERLRERGDSRFGTLYMLLVALAMAVAMGTSLASEAIGASLCLGEGCRGSLDPVSVRWLAAATAALTLGAVGAVSMAVGPVGLSSARASWLGSAPGDRALVLRDPVVAVTLSGGVAGLLGGIAAGLAASGAQSAGLAAAGGLAGAMAGAAVVLVAAVAQVSARAKALVTALSWSALVVGSVVAAATVGPWPAPELPAQVQPQAVVLLVGGVALAAGGGALAVLPGCLRLLTATELRRSGDALDAVSASVLMLEGSPVQRLRESRALTTRGRFRSTPLRGRGPWVIAVAEARRLRRSPLGLVGAAMTVPVPVIAGALFGPLAAIVLVAFGAVVVATRAAGGLRLWTRSSWMARLFPHSDVRVRLAYLAVPTGVAALWSAIAAALVGLTPTAWLVVVLGAAAAALRSAPESHTGLAAAQTSMSPMGAVPVGLIQVLVKGPDVAAPALVLLLFGLQLPALVVALVVLGILLPRGAGTGTD